MQLCLDCLKQAILGSTIRQQSDTQAHKSMHVVNAASGHKDSLDVPLSPHFNAQNAQPPAAAAEVGGVVTDTLGGVEGSKKVPAN